MAFNADEITRPGVQSPIYRELFDPDLHVMVGKIAAEVARQGTILRELVDHINSAQKRSEIRIGGILVTLQTAIEVLRQLGVLK